MNNTQFIHSKIIDLNRSIRLERSELRKFKSLTPEKKEDMLDSINIKKLRLKELRLELLQIVAFSITRKHK